MILDYVPGGGWTVILILAAWLAGFTQGVCARQRYERERWRRKYEE